MTLRRLPYGANYLNPEEMIELDAALQEKILFRYTTERESSGDQFEKAVMQKFGISHALATLNCTQSLRLALMATRPNVGDKVYIPAMTFVAVAGAVLSCGLIPVLTDVDENYSLDISKLPSDADRVIVAHMEGMVGPVPNVKFTVEDCAQAMGARHPDGRYAGTVGTVGVYSFHHAKVLTSGEGGLIVTNNAEVHGHIRGYHDHGSSRKHGEYPVWKDNAYFGENMVAGEPQTSIQLQQFRHLDEITNGLETGYNILKDVIPESREYDILQRKDYDQKISLRIRFKEAAQQKLAIEIFKKSGLPHWTFDRYFLPDHPILRDKKSLYADGFPWSLVHNLEELWDRAAFSVTKDRIDRTLCLPVSPEQSPEQQYQEALAYKHALEMIG